LEAIQTARPGTNGDLEYLRILHLAASTMETEVAAALTLLQVAGKPISADTVKAMVAAPASIAVPALTPTPVDLADYDALLEEAAA
jgi:hypothetical protein